ncbi:GNAT family N-acetyltransferase [Microbacterium sp. NPDC019599]|uniref:GNAT family N-acetyltransferase n=1 Tax=Microbacterium sp. NPDC019599 TaxID=3154690 RepID=UPI0033F7E0FE
MTDLSLSQLTIGRLAIPESLDAPDAGPFLDFIRIANAACRHDAGHSDLDYEPHEALVSWHDQVDWGHVGFLAERDGVVLGGAELSYQKEEDAESAEFELWIDPDHWGEGAEEALLAAIEAEALAIGRRTIQIFTFHRPADGGRPLVPSTGWGSIPADDRQTVFHLDNGFTLEQVERTSAFDLQGSFDVVERMLQDALEKAGPDYRPVVWTSPTPEQYREGLAYAISRMATDAPQGGLVVDEQKWDADRVRRRDERLQAQRYTVSVACVEHVPTGRIAAYNEIAIQSDHTAATLQWGTLVLKEHRGRSLGTIVKCANLLRWRELVPESPRVTTFNAEENRHMLDINEAIGFTPVSYAGAWKKVLD